MSFDELLILHASPTLANLKPASLVCLNELKDPLVSTSHLEERGLSFLPIRNIKGCNLILIYRKRILINALNDEKARRILRELGYKENLDEMLHRLQTRFQEVSCPHEVGLFLGYPPDDVIGFIENNGRNAIASGLWKVYSNRHEAEKLLYRWDKCKKKYAECFANGTEITRLCVAV